MNIKHILAQAAIISMIGLGNMLDAKKRPSVEDINEALADGDNHSYKLTAADCDAGFKAAKSEAQAQADILATLQQRTDDLEQSKNALAEQITVSGSLRDELEITKDELEAATSGAESTTGGANKPASDGETDVVLLTSVYDGGLIPCTGEAVAISDAVLEELTEGAHYTLA